MRLEQALADQTARPHPDKRGVVAIDQQISPVLAGHADHARNGVENAQQHFVRLPQPVLATFAVTSAAIRRQVIRSAARLAGDAAPAGPRARSRKSRWLIGSSK